MTEMLEVKIWRGKESGEFVSYDVPRLESQTVLDVVTHIQRHIDPGLSYRYACRVGMCGSCAMTVNGKARWTCRTHVAKVKEGDILVTDMTEFFDKWAGAKGRFKGERTRHEDFALVEPDSKERRAADAGIECIGCSICYSSCDVVSWRPEFLGPAALNRAWTLVNDVRDVERDARLLAVSGDAGCHACHTQGSCTERCPKQLAPTAAISGLKRLSIMALRRDK